MTSHPQLSSVYSRYFRSNTNSLLQTQQEHFARLEASAKAGATAAKPALYLRIRLLLGIINRGTFNWVVPLSVSILPSDLVYVGEMETIATETAARFPRAIISHSEDSGRMADHTDADRVGCQKGIVVDVVAVSSDRRPSDGGIPLSKRNFILFCFVAKPNLLLRQIRCSMNH